MGQHQPLFSFIFGLFKNTNFTTDVKKCPNFHPVYSAGIRNHDTYVHESSPITTRPGQNVSRGRKDSGNLVEKGNQINGATILVKVTLLMKTIVIVILFMKALVIVTLLIKTLPSYDDII